MIITGKTLPLELKLCQILINNCIKQPLSDYLQLNSLSSYDILVCTIGHKPMLKERMLILRDLWIAGLRADIYLEAMQVN